MINRKYRDRFDLITAKKQGKGGQGVIHQALDKDTGQQVAIKYIPDDKDGIALAAIRERSSLERFKQCENVVQIIKCYSENMMSIIVMELCLCDISELQVAYRAASGRLSAGQRHLIIRDSLRALKAVHAEGFAHRDIKLANFLVTDSVVKLCDFGLALKPTPGIALQEQGSRFYKAPEQLLGCRDFIIAGDLWAAGLVFLSVLMGCDDEETSVFDVFNGQKADFTQRQLLALIEKLLGTPTPEQLSCVRAMYFESTFGDFVAGNLEETLTGFGASDCERAVITALLRWDPHERISAVAALQLVEEAEMSQITDGEIQEMMRLKLEKSKIVASLVVDAFGDEPPLAKLGDELLLSSDSNYSL